jgi:hypothetical protein
VVIKCNYLHDLNPIINGKPDNTTAIRVTNAANVTIDNNRIDRTNYNAIGVTGNLYDILNVTITDNAINGAGCGIYVVFDSRHCVPGQCGSVRNVSISGNRMANVRTGIVFQNIGGTNMLTENVTEGSSGKGPYGHSCEAGYVINPLSSSSTTFVGNSRANCSRDYFRNIVDQGSVYNANSLY